ncbi:MAG: ADP-ribosylglycohydrolase family protein [Thermoflexales bacterium]|nr:ADP-ribosylglycohydrolase family protein [Thermoflexales bacterium]
MAGCLAGLALGDSLGRATEFMTRESIRATHGWLTDFAAPSTHHPGHADPLGVVTDDSTQALMIARLLAEGGALTPPRMAAALTAWSREAGGLDNPYLGPSTRQALRALMDGANPAETGRKGTTNGGAMRVAPIGVAHALAPGGSLAGCLRDVIAATTPTHNTHAGMQGAVCVAFAAHAAAQPGATLAGILEAAQAGAREGRRHGVWSWYTPLDGRIALARRLVAETADRDAALDALYAGIGVGLDPAESVAAAFGVLALADGEPMAALQAGINLGGDTDTVAAIVGAISGAWQGIAAFDPASLARVEAVNGLDFRALAAATLTGARA